MESNKTIGRAGTRRMILMILGTLLIVISCSAPKRIPYAEIVEMPNENLRQGRELFNSHCATCHPNAMAGLGPAIINKPLPESLIRFQIRNGLGVMPAFDETILSDAEVEAIAEYLVYLRKEKN